MLAHTLSLTELQNVYLGFLFQQQDNKTQCWKQWHKVLPLHAAVYVNAAQITYLKLIKHVRRTEVPIAHWSWFKPY